MYIPGSTPSQRIDPAAVPGDHGASSQGAPSGADQPVLAPPPGLHSRQPSSFSFAVEGGGTSSLPPRASVPEIVELPWTPTPEHDRSQMLRTGERSESSLRRYANTVMSTLGWGAKFLDPSSLRIASSLGGSAREGGVATGGAAGGRALGNAPTFANREAPPERNWRSVAAGIGAMAAKELALTGQSLLPSKSTLAGLAGTLPPVVGHVIHQAVAVGLPTFAREMLAAGVMHGLRNAPPETAYAVQGAVGAFNLGMQVIREVRERRHPDEAARGFHSLSPEQWAAKTPDEQAALRKHTQKISRAITVAQLASSITNLSLMLQAHSEGLENKAAMLRPLATEVKVGLYTTLRDAAQASFNMVGYDDKKDLTYGLAGNAFNSARATYAGVITTADVLSSAAMGVLVPGRGDAMATLVGTSNAMSSGDAWRTTAAAAGVGAVTNTLVEATDWFQRMHFELSQNAAPPPQRLEPHITGDDLGRVFDQAQSRTALINGLNSALSVLGLAMAKAEVPPALQGALGSAGLGALVFLTDSPITGNWQSQKAVRMEAAEQSAQKKEEVDLEAGLAGDGAARERTESSPEGSGRLTGTVPGRKTPGQSFRTADVPAWPPGRRSGSNSPPDGSRHDRSYSPSDDERRSGELRRRTARMAAENAGASTSNGASTSQAVPPGSSSGS